MEHTPAHRVDEKHMHPDYKHREDKFRSAAAGLWAEEANARDRIRSTIGLSDEERQDLYMQSYQGLEKRLQTLSEEFGRDVGKTIQEAEATLYAGEGKKFSEHLSAVANVGGDRLEELMNTATRSGQEELARAVAVTAYERGQRGLFNEWSQANPERAAAVERIKGTPGAEQLYTRTWLAMKPPRAKLSDLMPTASDERKAAEAEAARNAPRQAFFGPSGGVRRQVGSRISTS